MRHAFTSAWLLVLSSGCILSMNVDLTPTKRPYEEIVVERAACSGTDEKVALVDVHGILTKRYGSSSLFSSPLSPDPVADLKETLRRCAEDEYVKAVVLRIDSPGGVVSWCDMMYREIAKFRAQSDKPVVACVTGLGASGGYYLALAADHICASPTSMVGSIGVIAIFVNLQELAGKIGVETQVVKSGARKDMGGLWRALENDEKEILQAIVDEFHGRFVDLVLENRPGLTREALTPLADGRLYTARQALDCKLIDEVGYLDEAIEDAKKRAGIEDASVVTYARQYQYKNNIYSEAPAPSLINVDLADLAGVLPSGFYYLWQPDR